MNKQLLDLGLGLCEPQKTALTTSIANKSFFFFVNNSGGHVNGVKISTHT